MKPYHRLSCSMHMLSQIQHQVMEWINSNYPAILESHSLWNSADLVRNTPTLLEWCRSHDLKLRETALTVMNSTEGAGLHIDELPVTAKVNIPILNTKHSLNRWYHLPEKMLAETKPTVNKFGKNYYLFKDVDYSRLDMIGELELQGPVVFNSQLAHNVVIGEQCVLPRVVLTCMFFNEPLHHLQA
jgi:hypothetical protein